MRDYHAHFEHENYYHIYNRGNNGENLFLNNGNYEYFLSRWEKYIVPYTKTLAYCLMPNHFHFLILLFTEESFTKLSKFSKAELAKFSKARKPKVDINQFLENQFKRLFSSYALAFNKQQNRHGSLFEKRFKRIRIDSDDYLFKVIHYIHNNPIHHGFRNDYISWKYSSYKSVLDGQSALLDRNEVLKWFGGRKAFIEFHEAEINYNKMKDLVVDIEFD